MMACFRTTVEHTPKKNSKNRVTIARLLIYILAMLHMDDERNVKETA